VLAICASGCRIQPDVQFSDNWHHYQTLATQVEYPDAEVQPSDDIFHSPDPNTLRNPQQKEFWDLTLDDAVRTALANSDVMRDIGGRVVTTPAGTTSRFDPALAEMNPLSGTEAALAAFDAQFDSQLLLGHNERTFNNFFFGGGATGFKQNTGNFRAEISKPTAAGTTFSVRNITLYDRNTSPVNRFPGAYETMFEGEFRHPLLQGGGIEFNRIAGPRAQEGVYNGVLIARINTDVALADFEIAVRDLVRDVEQTYWELYFTYRDLDAQKINRDVAMHYWRLAYERKQAGGGDVQEESLTRAEYFAAQAAVQEALAGNSLAPGVYGTERRLRRLLGLPATDDRLIRPADEPKLVEMKFDWRDSLTQAFWRRPELRRQQWNIKRRELELTAARNFQNVRLDLLGLYRWRGFGDDLLGNRSIDNGSAFRDLFTGDLQDWQFGMQMTTPLGRRLGHAATRHAELQLARERAVYRDQELQVSHELAEAFSTLDRAFFVTRSNYNRQKAATEHVRILDSRFRAGRDRAEFLLDALRGATVANVAYYRALADFNLALMQIHVSRGTLLEQHGVSLAEGAWSAEAHAAAARESERFGPYRLDQCHVVPCPISAGPLDREVPPPLDSSGLLWPEPAGDDPLQGPRPTPN
jgi:outer membrane protein TolC